jgi:hypothetical protein
MISSYPDELGEAVNKINSILQRVAMTHECVFDPRCGEPSIQGITFWSFPKKSWTSW